MLRDRKVEAQPKGLVTVHTSHGKGKTIAALGVLMRGWGRAVGVALGLNLFIYSSGAAGAEERSVQETVNQMEAELRALKERVGELEDKLAELRGQTLIVEPAEEIKRITEYVCPEGHTYDLPQEGGRCPVDNLELTARTVLKKRKYARRESISEKIEVALQEELKKKAFVGVSATAIGQQLLGSKGQDKFFATGSADIFFFAQPMYNTTFFVNLEAIGGEGPDGVLRSLSGLNDDVARGPTHDSDGVDRVAIREAWLEGRFFSERLRLVAGKIDLTNYFEQNALANDETTQFITSAFVNNPLLFPPPNGPGGVALWDTQRGWYIGAGFQSRNNSGSNLTNKPYTVAEVGYYGPFLLSRPGSYRLWGAARGSLDARALTYGLSVDQELTQSLGAFARYGLGKGPGASRYDYAWSIGMELRSPFSWRPQDRVAMAFGRHWLSPRRPESIGEVYYSLFLTDHVRLTPSLQFLFDFPGSEVYPARDFLTVVGMRAQVDF